MKDSRGNYLDPVGGTKLFSKKKQKTIEHMGNRKKRGIEAGVFDHPIEGLIVMTQSEIDKTDYEVVKDDI